MEDSEEYKHNLSVLATLNIGDIVEFPPRTDSYWGVYVGGGNVVSLISAKDRDRLSLAESRNANQSSGGIFGGFFGASTSTNKTAKEDLVRKLNFFEVAGKSKAKKNNLLDDQNTPLTPSQIVDKAVSQLRKADNTLFSNDFDFALWCRYGEPVRNQKMNSSSSEETAMECSMVASAPDVVLQVTSKVTEEAGTKGKGEFKLTSNNSKDFAAMCRYGKTSRT